VDSQTTGYVYNVCFILVDIIMIVYVEYEKWWIYSEYILADLTVS